MIPERLCLAAGVIALLGGLAPTAAVAATLQQQGGTCVIDCDLTEDPVDLGSARYRIMPVNPVLGQPIDQLIPGFDDIDVEGDNPFEGLVPTPTGESPLGGDKDDLFDGETIEFLPGLTPEQ